MPEQQIGMSREAISNLVDVWSVRTAEQEEERARIPLKVLLGEAIDLAEVIDKNFDDQGAHGKVRLGLNSIVGKGPINQNTSTEMRELQTCVSAAQARYLVLVQESSNAPIESADDILDELRFALGFLLEDGDHPKGEEQLSVLREQYGEEQSHDGTAMALEGYGELAGQYVDELVQFGGFDPKLVDQANQVARALRQRSADKLTGQVPQEQKDILRLRNRLLGALMDRMRDARRSIRYVFRKYPEITKQAGSDYSRSRQRAHRKKSGSGAPPANDAEERTVTGEVLPRTF